MTEDAAAEPSPPVTHGEILRLEKIRFDRLVREGVVPVLRPAGFERKGRRFQRDVGTHWWVVGVDRSRTSTDKATYFSLTYGVHVNGFVAVRFAHVGPERVNAIGSFMQQHLRCFGGELDGGWVKVAADLTDDKVGRMAAELRDHIRDTILPWLLGFATLHDIADWFLKPIYVTGPGPRPLPVNFGLYSRNAAAVLVLARDWARCEAVLDRMLVECRENDDFDDLQRYAQRLRALMAERKAGGGDTPAPP